MVCRNEEKVLIEEYVDISSCCRELGLWEWDEVVVLPTECKSAVSDEAVCGNSLWALGLLTTDNRLSNGDIVLLGWLDFMEGVLQDGIGLFLSTVLMGDIALLTFGGGVNGP